MSCNRHGLEEEDGAGYLEARSADGTEYLDPVVSDVMDRYKERSRFGMEKYGVPMTRDDIDLDGWLNHLQEELMDAVVYIERIRRE